MAIKRAVTDTSTGRVKRYGFSDFENDGSFDSGTETQVTINSDADEIDGVPLKYTKVVSGAFVEMSSSEKDDVDDEYVVKVRFHASSKLIDGEVAITQEGSDDWQELGSVVSSPGFFVTDLTKVFGRLVFAYLTDGANARLRLREDNGTSVVTLNTTLKVLGDTSSAWKYDLTLDTDVGFRNSRNRYILEGQLNGATAACVAFASITLLERLD